MAQRVYLDGSVPRLITSKAGYDASPSLADTNKTFDSNWFNGCGIKFKYWGNYTTNFVYTFPYALSFIPKFLVQYQLIWNGNSDWFYYTNPGQPGYSVNPPNDARLIQWQGSFFSNNVSAARAYTDRIELNNPYSTTSLGTRVLILVFES